MLRSNWSVALPPSSPASKARAARCRSAVSALPRPPLSRPSTSSGSNANNSGEVRETIVSLGKQLSRRWYVGYERSLNATAGNWQLIYRIAQRFTLRAQSGLENSLDLIWTWRWE
jgi:translocation and assembly module TamB